MKRRLLTLTIALIFTVASVFAQNSLPIENLIPNSPEASTLFKFQDVPISKYTGTAGINVPVTSISEQNLAMPISLSYHTGGHQVSQLANWVGLGWKLNVGGMISRKVHGKADDTAIYGFLSYRENISYQEIIEGYNRDDEGIMRDLSGGCYDSQPDEFYFDVGGLSGKFAFDWDSDDPIVSCDSEVEIFDYCRDSIGNLISWVLRGPDGVKYVFNERETTTTFNILPATAVFSSCKGATTTYISSWYLSETISPNNPNVNLIFSYDAFTTEQGFSTPDIKNFNPRVDIICPFGIKPSIERRGYSKTKIFGKKISKIEAGSGYFSVDFVSDTPRNDISDLISYENYNLLDEVILRGKSGSLVTKHKLNYKNNSDRLILESVTQFDDSGQSLPPYRFKYNEEPLPPVDSKSIDHWGFYNCENNQTLIPEFFEEYDNIVYRIEGGNREPNLECTKASMLESITYPTGGMVDLEYELNSYSSINGEEVNETVYETDCSYNFASSDSSSADWIVTSIAFQVNSSGPVLVDYVVNGITYADVLSSSMWLPRFSVKDLNGQTIINEILLETGFDGEEQTLRGSFTLLPGDYILECKARKNSTELDYIATNLKWVEETGMFLNEKKCGGLRIKKKVVKENEADSGIVTTYEYLLKDEILPSGVIYAEPLYTYTQRAIRNSDNLGFCYFKTFIGANQIILGNTNGSHIGYRFVTEYHGLQGENGKIECTYLSPHENRDFINVHRPFGPPTSQSHKTGLLKEKITYDASDQKVLEELNNYYFFEKDFFSVKFDLLIGRPTLMNYGIQSIMAVTAFYLTLDVEEKYVISNNNLRFGYSKIKNKTIRNYYPNGEVEKYSEYEYDGLLRKLKKEITYNSDGKKHETEYEYPNAGSLFAKHMLGIPIKTTTKVGGSLTGGQKIVYADFGDITAPSQFFQILEDGSEFLRLDVINYDLRGKITNYKQPDILPVELEWDVDRLTDKYWGGASGRHWQWNYYDTGKIKKTTSIDGQSTDYYYDGFNRLELLESRNGEVTMDYAYEYQIDGGTLNSVYTNNDFEETGSIASTQYLDGLGRSLGNVDCNYSPSKNDITITIEYDNFGRSIKEFLPEEGGNECTFNTSSGPHTLIEYEPSPLNRPIKHTPPEWPKSITTEYETNSGSLYGYDANSLYMVRVTDENGNPTETYTDKIGRQILIRKVLGEELVDTYFRYDDRNNLISVISPEGNNGNAGDVNYSYRYNLRNLVSRKKLPGQGAIRYPKYKDNDLLEKSIDAKGDVIKYFYNDYGEETEVTVNNQTATATEYGDSGIETGRVVSANIGIVNDNSITGIMNTRYTYDEYGRTINENRDNHLGGSDYYTYTYDGADNLLSNSREHVIQGDMNITESFTYDHSFRQVNHSFSSSLTSGVQLSSNTYTFKDELKSKLIGEVQLMEYGYNVRSWLTGINSLGSSLPFEEYECAPDIPFEIDLEITPFNPCDGEVAARYATVIGFDIPEFEPEVRFQLVNCDSMPECPSDGFQTIIDDFMNYISTIDAYDMSYPQNLTRVRLCDGQEIYITDSELLLAQINGIEIPIFIVLQEICVEEVMQLISYVDNNGDIVIVPFYQLMDLLNSGLFPQVENYPLCGQELVCQNFQEDYPIRVVKLNTLNTDYLLPECDITKDYFHEGLCSQELDTDLSSPCYTREANWCFDFETFYYECDQLTIDSTVFTIDFSFNGDYCESDYLNNTRIIEIDGISYDLNESIAITLSESQDNVCFNAPEYWEPCNMCVYSISRTTHYSCGCPTENPPPTTTGELCTCVPNEPVAPSPCMDVLPVCTAEEIEAQEEYIDDLIDWAKNVTVNEVDFPIEMCRTTLCDGRQISIPLQYLENHPLPGPQNCENITSTQEPPPDCNISNPLFAMKFSYESPNDSYSGAIPQYNGNISQIEQQQMFKHIEGINYEYDQLDRLKRQNYWWRSCKNQFWNNKFYNVEDITYDLNGNMKTIKRNTIPFQLCEPETDIIDNLTMSYSGNQLASVSEGVTDTPELGYIIGDHNGTYQYDANGNMTTIGNKGFTLDYNFLNLPSGMGYGGSTGGSSTASISSPAWTYSADGTKLKYKNNDYVYGIEYKDGALYCIHHAEGRVFPKKQTEAEEANNTPPVWEHNFYLKDHLGNTRIVLDGSDIPIQENNYYPFGMNMDNIDAIEDDEDRDTRYTYNGKEMNEDLGWQDYGARFYDPSISLWTSVDPLAEKYPAYSGYNYVTNNPIIHTDPTGRSVDGEFEKVNGEWVKTSTKGDAIGLDFYHTDGVDEKGKSTQTTIVSDRKGNKNYINNGRRALRGESRDNDVNWSSITNEFEKGTGPEYSYFEGDHPTNCDVECFYLYDKAYGQFANSGDDKGGYSPGFNPLKTDNMQGQMMGTSNFSFYKVGDKTLSIVQDSKSRTSLFYHLPVKNYSRAEGMPQTPVGGSGVHNFSGYNGPMNFRNSKRTTNTYQTYLIFN